MARKKDIKVIPFDISMLSGDISLSCQSFSFATLGHGSHYGLQVEAKLANKQKELKDACYEVFDAMKKIETILNESENAK